MYSNYCVSNEHLELLGIETLIKKLMKSIKKDDRQGLEKLKKRCLALCEDVGRLFDEVEPLCPEESFIFREPEDDLELKIKEIRLSLKFSVTGNASSMRFFTYMFGDLLEELSEWSYNMMYLDLLDMLETNLKETANSLLALKKELKEWLSEYKKRG